MAHAEIDHLRRLIVEATCLRLRCRFKRWVRDPELARYDLVILAVELVLFALVVAWWAR